MVITPNSDEFKDYPNRIVTFNGEVANEAIKEALLAGNKIVLIDDSDVILKKIEKDKRFLSLIASGRHYGCGWIVISRRTADIPTLCAKQAKHVFLFQTDLPNDIEFLNDFYYPAGDEVRDLNIEQHEFLYIDRKARTRRRMVA